MLTGFNTDVKHNGKIYHVQTEDKGRSNPIIETLIYLQGEIIEARRTSYREVIEKQGFQPQLIYKIMERQHRMAIADIRAGRLDKQEEYEEAPIDQMIDKKKTLDEIILEYLEAQSKEDPINLDFDQDRFFFEGEHIALPIRVYFEKSQEPAPSSQVVIKILSTSRPALTVFEGETDEQGNVVARFDIPIFPDGMAALLIQAFKGDLSVEKKQLIMKPMRKMSQTKKL